MLTVLLLPASALSASVVVGLFTGGRAGLTVTVVVQALLTLAGVNALLEWRRRSWSGIGMLRPRAADLGRALLVLVVGIAVNAALVLPVALVAPQSLYAHLGELQSVAGELSAGTPLAGLLGLLLLVGFYEEILARGLLLTRARDLFGGIWVPVLLSSVLFGLGHFYQGLFGVVQTAIFGAVLALFTIRWGTLWPAILAHAAINMLSVVQLGKLNLPS